MTKIAGTQYSIGSPTRRCGATGQEIAVGERYVAALAQSLETEEFVRVDFGESAWNAGARPAPPLVLLGSWRCVAHEGGVKRRLLIDDESLLDLFEQTAEDFGEGDPARERLVFRFVLALILLRKRLLIQEDSKGTTMLVRARGTPKPPEGPALVEVKDPGLDEDAVLGVTAQLAAVLSDDGAVSEGGAR